MYCCFALCLCPVQFSVVWHMSSEINFEKEKKCQFLNPHCGNYGIFLSPEKKSWKQHTVWLQNAIVIYLVLNAQISRNFSKKKMVREGISAFSTLWYIEKKHYLFFLEVVPIKRKCLLHSQENGCFLCIWLLSINLKGLLLFWSKWCK